MGTDRQRFETEGSHPGEECDEREPLASLIAEDERTTGTSSGEP